MSDPTQLDKDLFNEIIELAPEDRQAYLDGACRGKGAQRQRLQDLIDAYSDESPVLRTRSQDTLSDDPLKECPGTTIDRYKLLQKIGEGGMGVVFMAEQTEPVRRKVALKIIKLGMDTKSVVARFEAERQALALMDHPNIAKVLDAGATETGRPYFVMELVKGVPINTYCDKNHLPARERLHLFGQVCHSIQHAHQKGVIHRDIKPSNILVTLHDGKPVPKVIDFGIAKATNQRLTEKTLFTNFAQMIGTPAYMSPEQAEMSGLDVDTRTDVYSLGVLLYELLTGTTPFPEKELLSKGYGEMQRMIAEKEPDRPSLRMSTLVGEQQTFIAKNRGSNVPFLTKQLRGDLDWIAMKALEKDRTQRYASPNELAADLTRHLNNEPVSAAAPSLLYPFQKFYRRHRKAVLVAAAVTVGFYIAGAFAAYQAVRAKNAEQQANLARDAEIRVSKLHQEERDRALIAEAKARQGELDAQELAKSRRVRAYVADMVNAQAAIKDHNYGHARNLLLQHKDPIDGEDLRAFEWRYLWESCQDRSVHSIDLERWGEASMVLDPTHQWLACKFQFKGDQQLDIVSYPRLIPVYSIEIDESIGAYYPYFSRDGKYLLLNVYKKGGAEHTMENGEIVKTADIRLVIYRTDTWELIQEMNHLFPPFIFLDDNQMIASTWSFEQNESTWGGNTSNLIGTIGPEGWNRSREIDPLPFKGAHRASFCYESGIVAAGMDYKFNEIGIWKFTDETQPELIRKLPSSHMFALGQSGNLFASLVKAPNTIDQYYPVLYKTRSGKEIALQMNESNVGFAQAIQFNSDGSRLVTGGIDYRLRVWNTENGNFVGEIPGHPGEILDLVATDHLVTCIYKSGQVKSWNLREAGTSTLNWKTIPLVNPAPEPSSPAELSHKQQMIRRIHPEVVSLFESKIIPWRTPHPTRKVAFAGTSPEEMLGQISPDGRYLQVYTPATETIRYLDLENDDMVVMESKLSLTESKPEFVSNNQVFVKVDRGVELWNLSSQERLILSTNPDQKLSVPANGTFSRPQLTSSHHLLLFDSKPTVWDLATNQPGIQLAYPDISIQMRFSPDAERILVTGYHPDLHLYDAETGQITQKLLGHKNGSNGDFSPDGRTLFSICHSTARLWNLETGLEVLQMDVRNISNPWISPGFTLDGNGLYAWVDVYQLGLEHELRIMTLPTLEAIDAQIEKDLAQSH